MARLLLCSLLVADLLVTTVIARQVPAAIRTGAIRLNGITLANPPSSLPPNGAELGIAGATEKGHYLKHHRAFDKSVAGGEVILGGLATTMIAAVVCYIRVTRQRVEENKS